MPRLSVNVPTSKKLTVTFATLHFSPFMKKRFLSTMFSMPSAKKSVKWSKSLMQICFRSSTSQIKIVGWGPLYRMPNLIKPRSSQC